MPTVFSHIIQKRFSQVNEDVATDALAYILESSQAARRGIQALLSCYAPDLPELTFKTRQSDGSIRPDMCGLADNEPHVYIENKFWAGLTDKQPVSYLKELAEYRKPSVLLFVAPEKRQHTLWRELLARLRRDEIPVVDSSQHGGMTYIATTSIGPTMALTSWAAVLSTLETQAMDDPSARSDISQLWALCEAADSEAFLPIDAETLSDQRIPQFVLQLSDLVQSVAERGVARMVLNNKGVLPQSSWERMGRYSNFGDDRRGGGWFGIHFRLWRKYGRTPLWLYFHNTKWGRADSMQRALDPWAKQTCVFTAREANGDYVIALDIPTAEEKSVVVEAIVDQLEAIYQQMPMPDAATVAEPNLPEEDHEPSRGKAENG